MGQELGVGAYLTNLRRTAIDKFLIKDAVLIDGLNFSIRDYSFYDTYSKNEQNEDFKYITDKIDKFLKRYAIVKVTNSLIYYNDINFNTNSYKNKHKSNVKYVEHPSGEFDSYDGKKLMPINRDVVTSKKTYDGHLSASQLFHYDNFPGLRYTKVYNYITYDIENNMSLNLDTTPEPVISLVCYSNVLDTTFSWLLKHKPEQEFDASKFDSKVFVFVNEVEMLKHFLLFVRKLGVSLIQGWNSDGFDNVYLLNRCKAIGVNVSETFKGLRLNTNKEGRRYYRANNMIFFDLMTYYKMATIKNKPKDFKLNTVAEHVFKENKVEHEGIDVMWINDPHKLIEYNIQDVYLTERISVEVRLLSSAMALQSICPQDFDNIYYNSKTIENLIHMHFKHLKFPTKVNNVKRGKFKGALVVEPKPGLYNDVAVLDYASLYPSIIITMNLSPETIITGQEFDVNTMAKIDDVIFDQEVEGIIPQITKYLLSKRDEIKNEKSKYPGNSDIFALLNNKEQSFKRLVNSAYGVLGYEGFFLYDERVARSITFIDREILKWTIKTGEDNGYNNLFSDTDSVFFELGE